MGRHFCRTNEPTRRCGTVNIDSLRSKRTGQPDFRCEQFPFIVLSFHRCWIFYFPYFSSTGCFFHAPLRSPFHFVHFKRPNSTKPSIHCQCPSRNLKFVNANLMTGEFRRDNDCSGDISVAPWLSFRKWWISVIFTVVGNGRFQRLFARVPRIAFPIDVNSFVSPWFSIRYEPNILLVRNFWLNFAATATRCCKIEITRQHSLLRDIG